MDIRKRLNEEYHNNDKASFADFLDILVDEIEEIQKILEGLKNK